MKKQKQPFWSVPRLVSAVVLAYVSWNLWKSGDFQEVLRFGALLVMAALSIFLGKSSQAGRARRVMARGTTLALIGAAITMANHQNWTAVFGVYAGLLVIGLVVSTIMTKPPKAKEATP